MPAASGKAAIRRMSARGLPYIQGLYILSEDATGRPVAIMDSRWITGNRTAAATAVAAKHLAREGQQDARHSRLRAPGPQERRGAEGGAAGPQALPGLRHHARARAGLRGGDARAVRNRGARRRERRGGGARRGYRSHGRPYRGAAQARHRAGLAEARAASPSPSTTTSMSRTRRSRRWTSCSPMTTGRSKMRAAMKASSPASHRIDAELGELIASGQGRSRAATISASSFSISASRSKISRPPSRSCGAPSDEGVGTKLPL